MQNGFWQKFLSKLRSKKVIAALVAVILVVGLAAVLTSKEDEKPKPNTANPVVREYQKRLPELKRKVEEKPDDASARTQYAIALYAVSDFKDAKTQYEKAVNLRPNDATLHNNLANTYRDLKKYDEAVKEYNQAIRIAPTQQSAYINLANVQIYALSKTKDGIETYKKALAAMPTNPDIPILLAVAYEKDKNINEARKALQALLAKQPDNAAAKGNLQRLNTLNQ